MSAQKEHSSKTSIEQLYTEGLHHAYLFLGASFANKEKAANELLQKLPSYQVIRVHGKQGENSSISIPQIREIMQSLMCMPAQNQYRVVWIDPASALTVEAGNALLKVLEEPLPRTLFFLFAVSAKSLLPTIVSRCFILRFHLQKQEINSPPLSHPLQRDAPILKDILKEGSDFDCLFTTTDITSDIFDACEYSLESQIQRAQGHQDFVCVVKLYTALVQARAAHKNHVNKQACIDLLYV